MEKAERLDEAPNCIGVVIIVDKRVRCLDVYS